MDEMKKHLIGFYVFILCTLELNYIECSQLTYFVAFAKRHYKSSDESFLHFYNNNTGAVDIDISAPLTTFLKHITLQSETFSNIPIPDYLLCSKNSALESKGIEIMSSKTLPILATNSAEISSDSFHVPNLESLANEYILSFHCSSDFTFYQFQLVATRETNIYIRLPPNPNNAFYFTLKGVDYEAGDSLEFSMDKYQTLQIVSMTHDLTGTYVNSSEKIAVFSGCDYEDPSAFTTEDRVQLFHSVNQVPSISKVGRHYVVPGEGFTVKILSVTENTTVYIRDVICTEVFLIGRGDLVIPTLTLLFIHVTSDKPVVVTFAVNVTNSFDHDMAYLTPREQWAHHMYVIAPQGGQTQLCIFALYEYRFSLSVNNASADLEEPWTVVSNSDLGQACTTYSTQAVFHLHSNIVDVGGVVFHRGSDGNDHCYTITSKFENVIPNCKSVSETGCFKGVYECRPSTTGHGTLPTADLTTDDIVSTYTHMTSGIWAKETTGVSASSQSSYIPTGKTVEIGTTESDQQNMSNGITTDTSITNEATTDVGNSNQLTTTTTGTTISYQTTTTTGRTVSDLTETTTTTTGTTISDLTTTTTGSSISDLTETTTTTTTGTTITDLTTTDVISEETTVGTSISHQTTPPGNGCLSCICQTTFYIHDVNMTADILMKIAEIRERLKIDKRTLSSSTRRKISASDPRPSARYVGSLGVVILVITFGGLLLFDAPIILTTVCVSLS